MKNSILFGALFVLASCGALEGKTFENLLYKVRSDDTVVITNSLPTLKGALVIPSEIKGLRVVEINPPRGAPGVFAARLGLTSVTIPGSVTNVAKDTFSDCERLSSCTFTSLRGPLRIGGKVFQDTAVKAVTLPKNVELDDNAFYDSDIVTVSFVDETPPAGLDAALNRIRESDNKLKVKVAKLEIPFGADLNVWKAAVPQFLKRRGVVVKANPRVWIEPSEQGVTSVAAGSKKLTDGAAVKPGTKLTLTCTPNAPFVFQEVSSRTATGSDAYIEVKKTVTMPKEDVTFSASYLPAATELAAFNAALAEMDADGVLIAETPYAFTVNGTAFPCVVGEKGLPLVAALRGFDKFLTPVTFSFTGLPKGLAFGTGKETCTIEGTPSAGLDFVQAPAFMTVKTVSGLSATRRLNLAVAVNGAFPPIQGAVTQQGDGRTLFYAPTLNEACLLAGTTFDETRGPTLVYPPKAKVKASGLPTGVKFGKRKDGTYGFTGTATKAGTYYVTITCTDNKVTSTRRVFYTVCAHPLAGSYTGFVMTPGVGFGTTSMKVDAQGRATLTLVEGKTKTSVKNVSPEIIAWNGTEFPRRGSFHYAFTLPADKRRALPMRTLHLSYEAAEAADGTMQVWLAADSETAYGIVTEGVGRTSEVRCWPNLSDAQLANSVYNTQGAKIEAAASLVFDLADGRAMVFSGTGTPKTRTMKIAGRLPTGKALTASTTAIAIDEDVAGEPMKDQTLVYAPILVEDADGVCYKITLPLLPRGFGEGGARVQKWNAAAGAFVDVAGTEHSRKNAIPETTQMALGVISGDVPVVLTAAGTETLPAAAEIGVCSSAGKLTLCAGKPVKASINKKTGQLKFTFTCGGVAFTFDGLWMDDGDDAFRGTLSSKPDKKTLVTRGASLGVYVAPVATDDE